MSKSSTIVSRLACDLIGCCVIAAVAASPASAQERIGPRFFPDQLVIPEPFVEDELSFPAFLRSRRPATRERRAANTTEIAAEIKKRLTTELETSLRGAFIALERDRATSTTGLENLAIGLKYQLFADAQREAVASLGLTWEVGGTGRPVTGAESFDTLHPAFLVGKGFGDLPDRFTALKPLALAARLGGSLPMRARQSDLLEWGLAVEFSLPYYSSITGTRSLPGILKQTIPMVEMDFQTGLNGPLAGKTTGTANIGAVWVGNGVQIGLEAVVPINERSGNTIGVRGFLRLDLGLMFGEWAGRPLFGREPERAARRRAFDTAPL